MDLRRVLEVINLSDTGRRRPHNEDSGVSDTSLGLVVLADGMGGYKAGEVASAIAVMSILTGVRAGLGKRQSGDHDDRALSPEGSLIKQSIVAANSEIYRTATTDPQCQGMGTTVVAVLFHDDRITIGHVGDSRLYRLRNNKFQQLTADHSLIQELVDRGFFTPEEAAANTPKNLVTRALGIEPSVQVDVRDEPCEPGDIYLLCSDGLNDMVTDEEIRLTLSKYSANLVSAGHELIRLANENGGKDNISVILARPRSRFPAHRPWYEKLTGRFR